MYASINSLVQVTLNTPQAIVYGGQNNNIISEEKVRCFKTFSVTKPNSCSLHMTQIMNDRLASFIQTRELSSYGKQSDGLIKTKK